MAEDIFAQKGWICPKCGRVLAPSTMYCLWCCSDMKETITTTTTTTTTPTTIPKLDTTPITVGSGTIDSSGTSYLVKTSSISRDSHEVATDEPQTEETEMERLERIDNELEDAWAKIRELTDEPQRDCDKCKWYDTGLCWSKIDSDDHSCHYEPKTEPQTDCAWK